jgi:TPR repeat protein/AcrR family transcriptional regulator
MEQYQSSFVQADPSRTRLLAAAQAMVLRGNKDFSIAELCAEAGVERAIFPDHFAGKTALMAALMRSYPIEGAMPAPVAIPAPVSAKKTDDITPPVPAQDEWFERRLRVFERALTALEAKAEATAQEQARVIAGLQQRLKETASPGKAGAQAIINAAPEAVPLHGFTPPLPAVASTQAEMPVLDEVPVVTQPADAPAAIEPAPAAAEPTIGQQRLGHFPELEALPDSKPVRATTTMRLAAIAAALLVGGFVSVGFFMGRNLDANALQRSPDGVAHRQAAQTVLHKTRALADAGDTRAQARLALAYLRGQGSDADANAAWLWCQSAAKAGNPVAQYLLGALYQQGDHVPADPAQAAMWFSRAAEKGNLKAMHNLAIAYAQGLGVAKDEVKAAEWFTRAAERGYVDSAFDLAVLYERGEGVPQDLKQALKWYGIAAFAGDKPSQERSDFLRSQMKASDIKLATNAAMAFAPLPALEEANSL